MWICKGFQKPGLEEERAVHSPLARRRLDDQAAFESEDGVVYMDRRGLGISVCPALLGWK